MRQGPPRHDIHPGLCICPHSVQLYASGHFGDGPSPHHAHRLVDLFRGEVVEENRVHTGLQHLWDLVEAIHLDLDASGVGDAVAQHAQRFHGANALVTKGDEVVVLHESTIRQVEAMVAATADANSV